MSSPATISPSGDVLTASRTIPWLVGGLFCAAYCALSLVRFVHFEPSSWDNAIFEQAVKGYANFGWPIVNIKGPGFNILGDHFSPITALLAPFYLIFPAAQTLLVGQAVLLALSVVVITRSAMRHCGVPAGVAVGVAYGLSFGIQSAVQADFHEVAFAALLLAFAGAAYLNRNWTAVVLSSLPLLLVKESLGLTVVMIGVVLALHGQRRRGLVLGSAGIVGMLLVLLLIIPSFNPDGAYAYSDQVGAAGGLLSTLLAGFGEKVVTVVVTVGVTGFLALCSPWVLLAIPTFGWRFLSETEFYWGTSWHYSLVLMPIMFVAMIDAIERSRESGHQWVRRYASQVPAIAVAVALAMQLTSPLSVLLQPQTYATDPRDVAARQLLAKIPRGATVETDIGLISHLVTDHEVYWIGTSEGVVADYVVLDLNLSAGLQGAERYAEATSSADYELIFERAGYSLAERVDR